MGLLSPKLHAQEARTPEPVVELSVNGMATPSQTSIFEKATSGLKLTAAKVIVVSKLHPRSDTTWQL